MRFKEFALKVFMVFIKAINYIQNNKLTYEHRSTYRGYKCSWCSYFCLLYERRVKVTYEHYEYPMNTLHEGIHTQSY